PPTRGTGAPRPRLASCRRLTLPHAGWFPSDMMPVAEQCTATVIAAAHRQGSFAAWITPMPTRHYALDGYSTTRSSPFSVQVWMRLPSSTTTDRFGSPPSANIICKTTDESPTLRIAAHARHLTHDRPASRVTPPARSVASARGRVAV